MIAEKQLTDGGIATMKDIALLDIILISDGGNYCTIERSHRYPQSLPELIKLPVVTQYRRDAAD